MPVAPSLPPNHWILRSFALNPKWNLGMHIVSTTACTLHKNVNPSKLMTCFPNKFGPTPVAPSDDDPCLLTRCHWLAQDGGQKVEEPGLGDDHCLFVGEIVLKKHTWIYCEILWISSNPERMNIVWYELAFQWHLVENHQMIMVLGLEQFILIHSTRKSNLFNGILGRKDIWIRWRRGFNGFI